MDSKPEILILCGGEGRRLRPVVSEVPKPLAPIQGKPFLYYLVKNIADQGFTNFCFLTGYKSELIQNYVQSHFAHLKLRFSNEKSPLGTGGSLILAMNSAHSEQFIALNGDTFFKINLNAFLDGWQPETLKMALKKVHNGSRYGQVKINDQYQVTSFLEKSETEGLSEPGFINAGIYAVSKSTILALGSSGSAFSLEKTGFPLLLGQKSIYAQVFTDEFIDIGIPEDYIRAQELIPNWTASF